MATLRDTLAYMMDPVDHNWHISPAQVQGMLTLMNNYFKAVEAARKEYETSMAHLLENAY
ncbi:MAG: hypothetical protein HPY62_10050, partial [Bacteroidales bacterium]|nr:hypothetical protein [Bacteroidales bacterium]